MKEPFYGKVGGFTGKVRFGEAFEEAARREFFEETGLTGDFQFIECYHKMAYKVEDDGIKTVVHDVLMIDFKVTNTKGDLIEKTSDTENFWIKYSDIKKRDDLFNTFLDKLDFVISPKKGVQYREIISEAEGY